MTKHSFKMSDVTGDTRGLARSAMGYDWNYYADDETAIFGTGSDATIAWDGDSLNLTSAATEVSGTLGVTGVLTAAVGVTATTGTLTVADGGAVTQGTSKSTAVTLAKLTGAVTTHGAALADDALVTFTVTNSAVAVTDNVILNHKSGGTLGSYNVQAHTIAAGSFKITLQNVSGGALSEALVLSYTVVKGAVS